MAEVALTADAAIGIAQALDGLAGLIIALAGLGCRSLRSLYSGVRPRPSPARNSFRFRADCDEAAPLVTAPSTQGPDS